MVYASVQAITHLLKLVHNLPYGHTNYYTTTKLRGQRNSTMRQEQESIANGQVPYTCKHSGKRNAERADSGPLLCACMVVIVR